jgi:electron transport complex protein RnfB
MSPEAEKPKERLTRRDFLTGVGRGAYLLGLGGLTGALVARADVDDNLVWQIDPFKCTQCGRCQTECVLDVSAVKCVHRFPMCGYCEVCFGFFQEDKVITNEGAENQMCPTAAIIRERIEYPYYEYIIDEPACIACGKCVKGCGQFGNGSLYLQVRYDRCLNCSECRIAKSCPADAFVRIPADRPYIDKMAGPDPLKTLTLGELRGKSDEDSEPLKQSYIIR